MTEEKKKLSEGQEQALLEAYSAINDAIANMEGIGRVSRELSLSLTKLEEAEMWAERGITDLGYDLEVEDEDEDEDEDKEGSEGSEKE